jgi:hypothetical protein
MIQFLIFSEKIIQYSRIFALQVQMSWNQAHRPLLIQSFPTISITWCKASRVSMGLVTTKQTTFLHR